MLVCVLFFVSWHHKAGFDDVGCFYCLPTVWPAFRLGRVFFYHHHRDVMLAPLRFSYPRLVGEYGNIGSQIGVYCAFVFFTTISGYKHT